MFKCSENPFGNFQLLKPTLPRKIIQLRKKSQASHVRRMKVAHLRKYVEAEFDISSPSTSKNRLYRLKTPFTTTTSLNGSSSIQSHTASTKSSFNYFTPKSVEGTQMEKNNSDTKLVVRRKNRYFLKGYKDRSPRNHTIGDSYGNMLPGIHSSNIESINHSTLKLGNNSSPSVCRADEKIHFGSGKQTITLDSIKHKQGNEIVKTPDSALDGGPSSLKSGRILPSSKISKLISKEAAEKSGRVIQSDKVCDQTKLIESPIRQVLRERICCSTSKIPVALSRLPLRERSKKTSTCSENNLKRENVDKTDSISSSKDKDLTKSPCSTIESEKEGNVVVENYEKPSESFAPVINSFSIENFPLNIGDRHLFDENKNSPPNKIYVSNWLNNMMGNGKQVNKQNSGKDEGSLHDNETYTVSSYDSIQQSPSKSEAMTENPKQNHPSSESDDAEEYYDIEEIKSDGSRSDESYEDLKEWRGQWTEDDNSTITVPSEADLDLQEHRESNFRDLPGYPKTPYYLRFPRYKIKEDENVIRSDGKQMSDALKQLRIGSRCNSTPRRKINNKIRIG